MRPGLLNSRVVVQQQSTTQDALGQPVLSWSTFATLWADVRHTSGIEAVKDSAIASVVRASIRVRYRGDLTTAMRVVHGSTTYNIVAVLPDVGGKEYVDLACEVLQ
jgi:SPP1 family predicted phage head-tail adaptor